MSYILDALRKSDQQRQRGTAPTLQTAHMGTQAHKRPVVLVYGALGTILIGAGIAIGWLHPWQSEQPAAAIGAARTLESASRGNAPLPANSVLTPSAPPTMTANTQPRRTSRGSDAAAKPAAMTSAALPADSAGAATAAQQNKVMNLSELPPAIQQEIPPMSISVHAYSPRPSDRMVSINDRMLREGGAVQPGLALEQITPDGMVFSYKGFHFRRGVAESR
jgi:general secretion pathway protein B